MRQRWWCQDCETAHGLHTPCAPRPAEPPAPTRYDGPPRVRELLRVADALAALGTIIPPTMQRTRNVISHEVALLREKAAAELEDEWPS